MPTDVDLDRYNENGFLIIHGVLNAEETAALRLVTAEFEANAARHQSDEIYDLAPEHTPSTPRVRRIKSPHLHHPLYQAMVRHPRIVEIVSKLIGPDVRLFGTKLNLKSAHNGEPVEWHQDWPYYPHTNQDVLNVGICIDDVDEDNGPLLVIPGSHRGPVYDHHAGGRFCGALDPSSDGLDLTTAVALCAEAGSITIHHVRAVHASSPNVSTRSRRLLLHIYAAADAWPLVGCGAPGGRICPGGDYHDYQARLVSGREPAIIRMEPVAVRLPFPGASDAASIYSTQETSPYRSFEPGAAG